MKKLMSSFVLAALFFAANGQEPRPMMGGGDFFGSVPDEKKPELSASQTVTRSKSFKDNALSSAKQDESAVLVKKGGKVSISGGSIKKSGDTTNDGQSNFYGLNAAVT
ncbi:MAG: hypothetical protein II921_05005, partial [Treponema sp.]|nr:hypothetical protein [Treponema sp.]